jgi:hypothetical protein
MCTPKSVAADLDTPGPNGAGRGVAALCVSGILRRHRNCGTTTLFFVDANTPTLRAPSRWSSLIGKVVEGYHGTVFAYGQTGSGKTHTIMGDSKWYGFIKILLNYLYDMKISIKVSVIEIYNDTCYDILNSNNSIYQREDSYGNIILKDITLSELSNKADINNLFNIINNNRKVGCSSQNNQSSRSHLQIKIESNNTFIKILDLAGSERASQSEFINRNLYFIPKCIVKSFP